MSAPAVTFELPGGVRLILPPEALDMLADALAARLATATHAEAPNASPYLTVREAAELLRAKPQRVYDLLSARRLMRYRDGTRVLIERAELDAYLAGAPRDGLKTPPTSPSRRGSRAPRNSKSANLERFVRRVGHLLEDDDLEAELKARGVSEDDRIGLVALAADLRRAP